MHYNEKGDDRYFPEVDVKYPEKLYDLHNDLPFLPERRKIEKIEKLALNLHDKTEYALYIRKLKKNIKSWISFKKNHKII